MNARGDVRTWMPWFPKDFLSSSAATTMSLEEQGAYRRLLDFQWMDGSIPSDFPSLGRLLGTTPAKARRLWHALASRFDPVDGEPGRLRNARLHEHKCSQEALLERRASAGAKGARSRWQTHAVANADANRKRNGNRTDLPLAKRCPPTPTVASATGGVGEIGTRGAMASRPPAGPMGRGARSAPSQGAPEARCPDCGSVAQRRVVVRTTGRCTAHGGATAGDHAWRCANGHRWDETPFERACLRCSVGEPEAARESSAEGS